MNEWYKRQRGRDDEARALSESLLGPEAEAFQEAMAVMARCLGIVSTSDWAGSLPMRRKIQYASYAFNLLWSAWDSMLAGRYNSAAQLERSIDDSSDFLMALYANPSLADEIPATTKDVYKARRTIRNFLDRGGKGAGTEWLRRREREATSHQPYGHVSHETTTRLPVTVEEGTKVAYVRPGGFVAEPTLRIHACGLGAAAGAMMPVLVLSFSDIAEVDAMWGELPEICRRHQKAISEQLEGFEYPAGEVDFLAFLSSDDEVTR